VFGLADERGVKLWTLRPTPPDHASPRASSLDETSWERIMWAALLTVAALSLLISSAFAAYATYLYFFGSSDSAPKGLPSIVPDEDPADRQSAQAAQDFLQSAARKK
jgi:hypothetical protein